MTNIRQIVIGPSFDRPALVLRPSADLELFRGGKAQENDSTVGRTLALLQGLPELLLAGYAGTSKLMEVQINGDLVRAVDGVGYRAFAVGDSGIVENARLFDPSHLTTLIDVAAIWRLASIVVGQKHLADIQATLERIEQNVSDIANFQRDEQTSKIESAYDYLRQVQHALACGEREGAVRHRLEFIEAEMDTIQRHLAKLFEVRLDTRVKNQNLLGYDDIQQGLPEKLKRLQRLSREHRLAGLTRLGALQMLSIFPGGAGLRRARSEAIQEGAKQNKTMCADLQRVMPFEVSEWAGRSESVLVNIGEVLAGQSKFQEWLKHRLLPEFLRPATKRESMLRGPTGSDTPRLDATKFASLAFIHSVAVTESESADRFLSAVSATERQVQMLEEPKRFLVEWGKAGPAQIREISA